MGRINVAQRGPPMQRSIAHADSLPAPVGGWNARDSLANMAPTDAPVLINMFPDVSSVNLRPGYTKFSTGLDGQVQTLMTYNGGATTEMWAWTDKGSLYDVSVKGAVGAAIVTGMTNGQWEYTNISTAGGQFLVCVNGADDMLLYDGSVWLLINAGSTPAITNVATADLINVVLFKHRLWFIEKNTLNLWYLPIDSIAGAAVEFSLQAVATKGGKLVDLDAWTLDAGYGADDNLVFITSLGQVVVYAGTDPASTTTWGEIGVWDLGSPIGTRCMLKWAGDLLILTFDGLLPLASALQSSRLDPRVALSDKIQGAITAATNNYAGSHFAFGWQIVYSAKFNAVWINVPVAVGRQEQYAMNTITKSWAQFQGWAANCWTIYNDEPYFGSDTYVGHAWDATYSDNGAVIPTQVVQAFNYFNERAVLKKFNRARPSIFTDGTPAISVGISVDFNLNDVTTPVSFLPVSFGLWDAGLWDSAIWGSGLEVNNTWQGVTGIGYCGAVQFKTASMGVQINWASTDVVYQNGWSGI